MAYERGLGSFSQALLNFLYLWKATFKTSIKVTTYLWSTVAKLQGLKSIPFIRSYSIKYGNHMGLIYGNHNI